MDHSPWRTNRGIVWAAAALLCVSALSSANQALALQSEGILVGVVGSGPGPNQIVLIRGTGEIEVISSGGLFANQSPKRLAVEESGNILVVTQTAIGGELLRIDPHTGAQFIISSGGFFSGGPSGLALDSAAQAIVTNTSRGVFAVDPETGIQSFISGISTLLRNPQDVAVDQSGDLIVAATGSGNDIGIVRV